MEKCKILILSLILNLTPGWPYASQAQLRLANESCHASVMPKAVPQWSSFSPMFNLTQQNTDNAQLTTFEKIINVPIGIVFGSFAGYLIGTSLPSERSVEKLANRIKGGLIGAFAGPFINYEIMSAMKGVRNPLNNWYVKAGGNIVFPNYEDVTFKPGYSIGISRYFPMSNMIALQGNFAFQARQFSLPSQRILHTTMVSREIHYCDIDFSVDYIDMALLLNVKLLSLRKSNLNIAIGPSLSLEMFDNTKYHLIKVEEDNGDYDFVYIDDEPDPLFGYPALVYQLDLQCGKWIWQLGFQNSVMDTDEIFPLISKTRLRTFEMNVGYKL